VARGILALASAKIREESGRKVRKTMEKTMEKA